MPKVKVAVRQSEKPKLSSDSVVIGLVLGIGDDNRPKVSFLGCDQKAGLMARSTIAVSAADIGKQVALLFESGDWNKPLVIGKVQSPVTSKAPQDREQQSVDVSIDGERLTLTADKEIVLRCGKASVTLTRAGKIIIRGAYLSNRSSGVNKIKGASVQIN